jgi:2'-hydroxyisoflavone reductase
VIDVRDVAAFALELASRGHGGVFNLCAPPEGYEMRELLEACATAVNAGDVVRTYVPETFLLEHGVPEDEPVPYWVGTPYLALRRFDPSRAFAAGLRTRPLLETFRDCWAWDRAREWATLPVGLAPERERELLAAWHARVGA